jgi:pimeloyl-ACP methyl ester carboxylesterase
MNLILWLGAILIGALLVLGLAFWRWPLAFVHAQRRRALAAVARPRSMSGPRGPLDYWVAGERSDQPPGAQPTVVFLHGAGDHAGTWAGTVAALRDTDLRCLIPDLPGHWKSAPADGPLSLADGTAGLEALLEREAPERPVSLVGNSMGGWIALLYARRHPDRVARLVLEDAGGVGNVAVSLRPRNRREAAELMDAVLGPDTRRPAGFVLDHLVRRVASGPIPRIDATDPTPFRLDGELGELDLPATVIWGEHDDVLPPAVGEQLSRELPRAKRVTLPRCGHIPHLECPERFLPALRRALELEPGDEVHAAEKDHAAR